MRVTLMDVTEKAYHDVDHVEFEHSYAGYDDYSVGLFFREGALSTQSDVSGNFLSFPMECLIRAEDDDGKLLFTWRNL